MDTAALVDGGVAGLQRIVAALEGDGIDIVGAYLIRTTGIDGEVRTDLRVASRDAADDVLRAFVTLRAGGALPPYSDLITLTPVRPDDVEASRVLDYARQVGKATVTIDGVGIDGLYIEDAVVVKYPHPERAAA